MRLDPWKERLSRVANTTLKAAAELSQPLRENLGHEGFSTRTFFRSARSRLERVWSPASEAAETPTPKEETAAKGKGLGNPAPVVIFHHGRKLLDVKELSQLFDERGIPHQVRSVEDDLPNREAVLREAKGYPLPCVFVGGEPQGGLSRVASLARSERRWNRLVYPFQS